MECEVMCVCMLDPHYGIECKPIALSFCFMEWICIPL